MESWKLTLGGQTLQVNLGEPEEKNHAAQVGPVVSQTDGGWGSSREGTPSPPQLEASLDGPVDEMVGSVSQIS